MRRIISHFACLVPLAVSKRQDTTKTIMSNDKLYFKNLDSIRFIAALMVFLQHAVSPSYEYLPIKNTIWEKLLNIISSGGTGVSIFFVLSGFLITYLLISEYELNSKISIKYFYLRRVLRIWPLYFLVVAFSFLLYPFLKSLIGMNNPLGSNFLYHLTFLSNFDVINIEKHCYGSDAMSQNITWSVSIEEQFYLFWPLIFVFLPKRLWVYSILIVIVGSIFFRIMNNNDGIILYFHTFSVLLDLGIGGLMALLIKSNKKISSFFEDSSSRTHITLFVLSFCLLFWTETLFPFKYGASLSRIFISFSFALIISAQAITKRESKFNLGKISFANKWGKYTYGIYLIHPISITIIDIIVRVLHFPKTNFITLFSIGAIGFILTLFLSKMSFRYYESRFLTLKDKFTTIQTHG
jgi:peptidoglycan/LPS O-acetylase OafA/YrhL